MQDNQLIPCHLKFTNGICNAKRCLHNPINWTKRFQLNLTPFFVGVKLYNSFPSSLCVAS